jgi:hypothetical protein
VKPAHTDVGDSHLYILGPANFDATLLVEVDHVDSFGGRISDGLNDHVILAVFKHFEIQKALRFAIFGVNFVRERPFAYFTLQLLPDVTVDDRCFAPMLFVFQPLP